MIQSPIRARVLVGLAAVVMTAAACTSGAASPAASAPAASAPAGSAPAASGGASGGGKQYVIGFSNTGGTGNGFREEQNCTAKAEALASGQVSKVNMIAHNTSRICAR
jgi:hypothetical protein